MKINNKKLIYGAMFLCSVFLTACGGGGGGGTAAPATTYTIGGTVSGLTVGQTVTLQNNGGNDLVVSANAAFSFTTPVASGNTYNVTVLTQPFGQTCTAGSNTGSVNGANVTSVSVTCSTNTYAIGGTVSGLAIGQSVTLQNNGGGDLVVGANGSFTFISPVAHGATYFVTVLTPPAGQTCTAGSNTGTVYGANVTSVSVTCSSITYTIGGTVTGLTAGKTVNLQNNGGGDLVVSANGSFTFSSPAAHSATYSVTVLTQPIGQTCTAGSNTGTVYGVNVTSVSVICSLNAYTVGGTVSGLTGSGLVLRNNGGDDLVVGANGSFTFSSPVAHGATYAVTVQNQPAGQTCTAGSNTGTVYVANVTSVSVICSTNTYTIGGTISGLAGTVVLQNNGGNDLVISTNGPFAFSMPVASGASYAVTVLSQPTGRRCTVTSGIGANVGANVSAAVSCVAVYTVSVNVTGVGSSIGLIFQNNNGDNISAPAAGVYNFSKELATDEAYNVKVLIQPAAPALTCTSKASTTLSSGVMAASAIAVDFACAKPLPLYAFVANHNDNTVSAYSIGGTGALTSVGVPVAAGTQPQSVTVVPSGKFAYVANFNSSDISAYNIDPLTGALTQITCAAGSTLCNGSNYLAGTNPIAVTVDPSGQFLYSVNLNSNDISAYTINPLNGDLTSVGATVATGGNLIVPGSGPTAIAIDHTGQFVFVTNANDGSVSAYTISPATGALTQVLCGVGSTCEIANGNGSSFLAGVGPQSIEVDPTSKFVYVANSIGGSVAAYTIDPLTGALALISCGTPSASCDASGHFLAEANPTSIAIDATGKYIYVANKNSNNISAYSITAVTGALVPVAGSPFATGAVPASVTADLSGQYVYAVNFGSGFPPYDVSAYLITTGGMLTPINCGGGAGCNGANFLTGASPASIVTTVLY